MGYLCANILGLSGLEVGPMYATDRQTSDKQTSDVGQTSEKASLWGGGIIMELYVTYVFSNVFAIGSKSSFTY